MILFLRKFELFWPRIAAMGHANKLLKRLRNFGPSGLSFHIERCEGSWLRLDAGSSRDATFIPQVDHFGALSPRVFALISTGRCSNRHYKVSDSENELTFSKFKMHCGLYAEVSKRDGERLCVQLRATSAGYNFRALNLNFAASWHES